MCQAPATLLLENIYTGEGCRREKMRFDLPTRDYSSEEEVASRRVSFSLAASSEMIACGFPSAVHGRQLAIFFWLGGVAEE